jgi:hypothetical protein
MPKICAHATHAILLASRSEGWSEWRTFCRKLKLKIVAELHSDYAEAFDTPLILSNDGIYRGSVHHLERGDLSVQFRPTVIELAKILVQIANSEGGVRDDLQY